MRLMILVMIVSLFYLVSGKNNVKSLTESMGQEVIEIGTPIKELPVGVEEEPSAEEDDDEKDDKVSLKATNNTPIPATKKDSKKTTTLASIKKDATEADKVDGMIPDDEEDRIEKELAEIYKDTADYKTEEEKVSKEPSTAVEQPTEETTSVEEDNKPIGRQRNNFRFQPDATDKASIEKFRTSVDDINCYNRQKLSGTVATPPQTKNAFRTISNGIMVITAMLAYVFICT